MWRKTFVDRKLEECTLLHTVFSALEGSTATVQQIDYKMLFALQDSNDKKNIFFTNQGLLRLVDAEGHALTEKSELLTSVGVQDIYTSWLQRMSSAEHQTVQPSHYGSVEMCHVDKPSINIYCQHASPAVIPTQAVTALPFKISSGACSRFRPHAEHLPEGRWLARSIQGLGGQLCSARPAQECATDSFHMFCICRNLG